MLTLALSSASAQDISWLSEEHQQYLSVHKIIPICADPAWAPVEWINEEGQIDGVSKDYLDLLSSMLGVRFELIPTKTWTKSEELLVEGECMLVPSITKTAKRSENLLFGDSYFDGTNVIITQSHVNYLSNISQLEYKSVSMVKDYAITEYIKSTHPKLLILERDSIDIALMDVIEGTSDAAIGLLLVTSHKIQENGLTSLKVNAEADYINKFSFGFNQRAETLKDIMQLALNRISAEEKARIINRWYKVEFDYQFNRIQVTYFSVTVLLILLFGVYHHIRVGKVNKQLKSANEQLSHKHRELTTISEQDRLTGIYNRVKLESSMESEISRCERYDNTLTLMILDIDFFKKINDQHGHLVGDQVLMEFANLITGLLRKSDIFGRWGGEEFLIICPQTTLSNSELVASKLLDCIRGHEFPEKLNVTCSIGISEYQRSESEDSFIERADQALYHAKKNGRDRYAI